MMARLAIILSIHGCACEDGQLLCSRIDWTVAEIPLIVVPHNTREVDVVRVGNAIDALNVDVGVELVHLETNATAWRMVDLTMVTDVPWLGRSRWVGSEHHCAVSIRRARESVEENTVRHELCHCLGLAHDRDDTGSLMYPVYVEGQTLREDDRETLRRLYGE